MNETNEDYRASSTHLSLREIVEKEEGVACGCTDELFCQYHHEQEVEDAEERGYSDGYSFGFANGRN